MEAKSPIDRLATLTPLLGTLLALIYDVGYFWGIDPAFFSMFSLSEHLVFASQAIPLAVLMTVSVLGGLAWLLNYERSAVENGGVPTRMRPIVPARRRRIQKGIFWFFVIAVPLNGFFGNYEAVFLLLIVILIMWGVDIAPFERQLFVPGAVFIVGVTATFNIGVGVAHSQMRFSEPFHRIEYKSGASAEGRVLRAGERGFLIFDLATKRARYLQREDIRYVERLKSARYPSLICLVRGWAGSPCGD